jgi:hypothetical protein
MKKYVYFLLVACLTLFIFPLQSSAATTDKPSSLVVTKPPEPVETTEVKALLNRTEVSNTLDKTTLSSSEKKNAQIEMRSEGRHRRHGGGIVYVSVGSVALVILLVIILM